MREKNPVAYLLSFYATQLTVEGFIISNNMTNDRSDIFLRSSPQNLSHSIKSRAPVSYINSNKEEKAMNDTCSS
jgi:hypothetical protein